MSKKSKSTSHSQKSPVNPGQSWHVYILKCADKSLYTGITTDISRRLHEHNSGTASKYTRVRLPAKLTWQEDNHTESSAKKREAEIKKLTRDEKLKLISS